MERTRQDLCLPVNVGGRQHGVGVQATIALSHSTWHLRTPVPFLNP